MILLEQSAAGLHEMSMRLKSSTRERETAELWLRNRGYDGACVMDWICQARCYNISYGDLSAIGHFDAGSGGSVKAYLHVSAIGSVALIPERSWSDFPFAQQGGCTPRGLCMRDQGSTVGRFHG